MCVGFVMCLVFVLAASLHCTHCVCIVMLSLSCNVVFVRTVRVFLCLFFGQAGVSVVPYCIVLYCVFVPIDYYIIFIPQETMSMFFVFLLHNTNPNLQVTIQPDQKSKQILSTTLYT